MPERQFGGVIKVTANLQDVEAALIRIKSQILELNNASSNISIGGKAGGTGGMVEQMARDVEKVKGLQKDTGDNFDQQMIQRAERRAQRLADIGVRTVDSEQRLQARREQISVSTEAASARRAQAELDAQQRIQTKREQISVSTDTAEARRNQKAIDFQQQLAQSVERNAQKQQFAQERLSAKSAVQVAEEALTKQGYGTVLGQAGGALQTRMELDRLKSMSPEKIYQSVAQGTMTLDEAQKRLGVTLGQSNDRFGRHIQNVALGMLEWQAMNAVMNLVGGTFNTVIDGTMRMDAATAKLSVTLGTTKAIAREYAETMVQQGVQYGQAPVESLGLATYATRVRKNPQEQQELYQAASRISLVTGEDSLKLMDSLNVTARNTGMSFEQLENLAVATFENTGTSAQTALDIMREIGPIAKQAGVDMVTAFSVVAQTADLTGGNVSEAANAFTRLTMLATNPRLEQQQYLNEQMGISYMAGGRRRDPNEIIREFTQKATQTDISKVWGGRPEVTQGLMPLLDVYKKTEQGENTILKALNSTASAMDIYKATTDTTEMAVKKLGAAASVMAATIIEDSGIIKQAAQGMTTTIQMLPSLLKGDISGVMKALGYDEGTINKFKQYQEQQPKGLLERMGGVGLGKLQYGEEHESEAARQAAQDKATELSERERELQAERTSVASARAQQAVTQSRQWGTSQVPNPYEIYMPYQKGGQWIQPQAQLPEKTIDLQGKSRASVQMALGDTENLKREWLDGFRKMYQKMGMTQEQIDQLLSEKEKTVAQAVAFVKSAGMQMPVTGTQAYFLEEAMRQQEKTVAGLPTRAEDFTQYSDEDFMRAKELLPQYIQQSQGLWRQQMQFQGMKEPDIDAAIQAKMAWMQEQQLPAMRGNQMTNLTGAAAVFLPQILPTLSRTSGLEERLKDLRSSLEDLNETEKKRAQLEGQWNIPTGAKLLVPLTAESQKLIKEHGGETEDEAKNRRREQIMKEIAETEQKLAAEKAKDASILAMFAGQQTASDKSMTSLFNMSTAADTSKTSLDAFSQALGLAATGGVGRTTAPGATDAYPGGAYLPTITKEPTPYTGDIQKQFQTFLPMIASQMPQTIENKITISPITVAVQLDSVKVGQAMTPTIQETMARRLTEFAIGTPMITQ